MNKKYMKIGLRLKAFFISIGLLLLLLFIVWLFNPLLTKDIPINKVFFLVLIFGLTYSWAKREFFLAKVPDVNKNGTENYKITITYSMLSVIVVSFFLLSIHIGDNQEFATTIMCALASMSLGTIIGFLFALPKTLKSNNGKQYKREEELAGNQAHTRKSTLFLKQPNTNLEEVSDWLTKIIVGVTLVEFNNIISLLDNIAVSVAKSLKTDPDIHEPYILALLIFYLMFGFLFGYILTRLYLANLFSKADRELEDLFIQVNKNSEDIREIEKRIIEHSEVESLVAQADHYRRIAEDKLSGTPFELKDPDKMLAMSEALLRMAIAIDDNNIPARIVLSKCRSNCGKQMDALKELDELESHLLKNVKVSPKTHARINYNRACINFLHATKGVDRSDRKKFVDEAFRLLSRAVNDEDAFKLVAELDRDWKGMLPEEQARFNKIIT